MVYPFGAVRAVPAPPYGALPPDWASPFSPHVFAAGFDQKPRVMGGANHGIVNPLGKAMQPSWADATSRWQLPHERNRGVPEEAAEDARSQSLSWPNSTPIAPGTSLQGVHSRPNSAPVHFSRGRKDPPAARGYYETHPEVFTLGRDHPPNTFPHRTTKPQGERPAQIRTDRDISSLMPSLDLNQPPPLFEGGKLVSPSGNYLDTDPHPPVSRTRGQPGFVASPFPHIAYPETPYPVELPVTEPSNLSPPPYGKARVPPAFPMAHYPHIPYPLTVSPPRIAPDSSLYSNVHDPPLMDPSSFVLPVAYDYAALERPEGFVPPPPLQKLGYPRPPHLVAPVAYDPGQIAYDPARLPVPLHLQGAYPIPDPRSLNPSDPRALGFFPVSWAADARVQGVKNSVLQVPPDTKELAWGDPRGAAAEFARRGRPVRQYVTADKATVPARDKLRAMQMYQPPFFYPSPIEEEGLCWQAPLGVPPPVPPPPAAFANYPTWDLRASPMLPFGRNLGLACDSSVASNVVRRTDSENDLTVLPGRGDEARVPTRNESVEEIAYARRRELGSPVGDAVLGKAPVRSSRGAAHLTRLGEDPRGGMFVTEERFPRQFMQEQYLRGVEEGAKAAQWQRQCGSPQSTDVPAEPYAEDVVNRAVPSVSGTGVNKAARGHPEVRKKRSSDEATSKNSGEPETEQPPKKRSPNARMHAVGGPRGLL
ncbi:hypothetical protein KFL_001080260 [Klebsormidium nitens]|uniref:Uncharacterized protein n=1 Tax=Klebsormidium nitens TaxID=105231 RepID=A0A1Y1HUP3_KLENI|nr:hypothetical protein KFL_001080260 [Klebsormidium nitens]|eukprot:GAQ82350.1 hypothetical protein KFL_001080260 [Klebsormidium nitens]